MHGFEKLGLALEMFAHLRLDPGHVVRVHQAVPVRQHVVLVFRVAEHGLPATRQTDALRLPVEIPDAVIRGHVDEGVAFFHFLEQVDRAHALEAGCKGSADQFHQQVQVDVPLVDRPFAGQCEEACHLVANREADDQG